MGSKTLFAIKPKPKPNATTKAPAEKPISPSDKVYVDAYDNPTLELINRRRRQILVHSCIYYRLNNNLITDKQFDEWAYELVDLQKQYPEIAEQAVFAESFKDFDGSTGFNLPIHHPWVLRKAQQLLSYNH